ncbi:TonB-dependent receptor domain-containing protein [Methylobacillus pratensis]
MSQHLFAQEQEQHNALQEEPAVIAEEENNETHDVEENDINENKATDSAPSQLPRASTPLPAGTTVLPEIGVSAGRIRDQRINKTQSITTVTSRDLERTQAATIFEAVRDVPGVEISGGPRIAGMSFNVRGFQDNADVMIKVDGVRKSFEKYRMGGTFVDPELLKSIEVQRGPQIASGSGSIGGTVLMETKDAADLLRPGQSVGARIKFGYGNNNDEYMRSYTAYARPHERIDILYNYTNRNSNNFMLPKGSILSVGTEPISREQELNFSETSLETQLVKFSIYPTDSLQFTTAFISYKDSALVLWDQITTLPGTYNQVYRDVDDTNFTENIRFNPENIDWIDFKVVLGKSKTNVIDTIPQGWRGNVNPSAGRRCDGFTLYNANETINTTPSLNSGFGTQCRGNKYEDYSFTNTALEFSNNATLYRHNDFGLELLAGFQHNKNKRVAEAYFDNPAATAIDSIPSGTQSFNAIYVQPRVEWGRLSIIPGVRYDHYTTEAGDILQTQMRLDGLKDEIKFRQRSYSLGINFDFIPNQFSFFANYSQGFRAPMMAHYFSTSGTTCNEDYMPINRPAGIAPVCGSLYKPQLSESTEAGFSYRSPRFLGTAAEVVSKLTFFHIFTKNTLRSLMETSDGEIRQDGWERRNGVEVETAVEFKKNYARIGYSRNSGKMSSVAYDTNSVGNPTNAYMWEHSITTIPGNTLNITLGTGAIKNIDTYVSYRKVGERLIAGGLKQDGYEIFNAGIHYTISQYLGLRLIGENLMNKAYNYNGGGDFADQMGLPAAGRNIRFIVEMTY